ncbi:MAG TPA: capsule assembly Wzi family protein [Candidatus Acidoferrales bacterium]|nr:capsule assembly Wzi family protein [Candidatus Acidoferrales bacterium]
MIYTAALLLASTGMAARCQTTVPSTSSNVRAQHARKKLGDRKSDTQRSFSLDNPISTTSDEAYDNSLGTPLLEHLLLDQKAIWTSPSRLRFADADWLLPLGALTGGFLATDTTASRNLTNSASFIQHSRDFSNYGVASLVGAGAGMYLWGKVSHNDHARETGFLAGEAAIDSLAAAETLKYATGRERPLQDNYQGRFWSGGDSFPSEHAAAAWSIAGVIAHEYPGPLTKLLAYGAAAAVTASRATGKEHFPTDLLVGSAIGWFVGQYVYRAHHNPDLPGGEWNTYPEYREEESNHGPGSVGSPYVPLDSWVYPALERLAALGYIDTEFLGMRPWTRIECAQLTQEAEDKVAAEGDDSSAGSPAYQELAAEFQSDLSALGGGNNRSVRLESIYTRATGISGRPLNDSYHFGQTVINDYGRPFSEGFNNVTGISGWASAGRYAIYIRGEYQMAPSSPAYSLPVRNAIAVMDANPVQPATPIASASQFRLLDAYVAANVANWDLAFGKQSLWWGPSKGSAFLFSDNAAPIYMFRASRIAPFKLPWIFSRLGPMKWDIFFGELSGNEFPPRPLIHGEKISFKPTPNLEFGFTRTVEFGGVGRPLTIGRVWNSYVSLTSVANETPANDPGKRTGGFDFSYRVPFVRHWLTVYADSLATDDPSPLAAPRRAAINPGIYMPKLPGLPKLDFRAEAVYTDLPTANSSAGKFVYFDSFYRDLYTNNKNLVGSWIGREGTGFQAWSTYWASPRNSIEFAYRHSKTAADFVPGGGTLNDGSIAASWWLHNEWNISSFVQYEKWNVPLLASTPQSNWTVSLQIGFWPHLWPK